MGDEKLRVCSLQLELLTNFLQLKFAKETTILGWPADLTVKTMDEAKHRILIAYGNINSLVVGEDERDALPGEPDVLFRLQLNPKGLL